MIISKSHGFFRLTVAFIFFLYAFSYSRQATAESGAKSMFADDASSVMMSSDDKLNSNAVKTSKNKPKSSSPIANEMESYAGLQYWIDLQDSTGHLSRVTSNHVFQSGDGIKLQIKSKTAGYLYVLNQDVTGRSTPLFPLNGQNAYIEAGMTRTIPEHGAIRFDNVSGQEKVSIALSKFAVIGQPAPSTQQKPETLVSYSDCSQNGQAGSKGMFTEIDGGGVDMDCIRNNHSAGSKGMFTEEDTSSAQPASYSVLPSNDLNQGKVLFIDFYLTHR